MLGVMAFHEKQACIVMLQADLMQHKVWKFLVHNATYT